MGRSSSTAGSGGGTRLDRERFRELGGVASGAGVLAVGSTTIESVDGSCARGSAGTDSGAGSSASTVASSCSAPASTGDRPRSRNWALCRRLGRRRVTDGGHSSVSSGARGVSGDAGAGAAGSGSSGSGARGSASWSAAASSSASSGITACGSSTWRPAYVRTAAAPGASSTRMLGWRSGGGPRVTEAVELVLTPASSSPRPIVSQPTRTHSSAYSIRRICAVCRAACRSCWVRSSSSALTRVSSSRMRICASVLARITSRFCAMCLRRTGGLAPHRRGADVHCSKFSRICSRLIPPYSVSGAMPESRDSRRVVGAISLRTAAEATTRLCTANSANQHEPRRGAALTCRVT